MAETALAAILSCRRDAELDGFAPWAVEVGPDYFRSTLGVRFAGMDVRYRAERGATVFAVAGRKVGRYEVVTPERFEEP